MAFEKLIENERENREQLIKIFHQRKKESKDPNDDKLEQEEELNMPKNITGQMRSEIYNLKNSCDFLDVEIQRYLNKIEDFKRKMNTDIKTKEALDDKRFKLIDKIKANEKQKEKYINQIDLCLPISLDQFHQLEPSGRTRLELGQAIYIDTAKSNQLDKALDQIMETNHRYEKEEKLFTSDFDVKIREKRNFEKKYKDIETVFKNEQILKFGLEIDFNFLLQANKKTTVDRYESEYKKLKIESDRKVDLYKQKIADAKKTLQEETNNNTEELKKIMEKLQDKQKNDKKLEEKNSEIERLNEFIKEELLNNETSTKEYEQEIKSLKEEIKNNEDEAYHLKLEFGRVKEQNQKDIENLCNDYNNLKQEKEDNEQILNEKIAENFATVKNLENKLYQMEKSYQELSELSAKKLKETIDKYTDDIAKVREEAEKINKINSQTLEGIDITKLNKENYLLKSENIQLLADLRKYKNDVGVMQIQLNNQLCLQSSLTKTITEYKERINSLEELNDRLKSELFNVNLNGFSLKNIESNDENTAKFRESESKLVEELKEELK